jgi:ABC-type glycerol-3-phosphate transport system substrate-binding protein
MQQPLPPIPHNRHIFSVPTRTGYLLGLIALLTLVSLIGCTTPPPPPPPKQYENQVFTLRCPDAAFADAITPIIRQWEIRTGAKVTLRREVMTSADDTDIAIISAGSLGEWGEQGLLAPVPEELKRSENSFQWFTLLPAYGERLVEWGGQTLAVPLTGDGFVIVYRTDRFADPTTKAEFAKRDPRGLVAPKTWQEFADVAVFFAERDKKPSLPALPTDPDRYFDLFCRVASSADRRALGDLEIAAQAAHGRDVMAFQFAVTTGKPRLQAFGFQEAAKWLERLQTTGAIPTLPPGGSDDPVAALAEDRAVLAVLSLDQLSRLPREKGMVPKRFGIAGIPGSNRYFNRDTGQPVTIPNTNAIPNYVPHFSGGRLGVVRSQCKNMKTAFELVAELGSSARSSEYVATPGLGAGPIRDLHLNPDRLIVWLGYGFDEERSKTLQEAMRHYIGESVKNPTLGLRGPDRAALIPAAVGPLRQIGNGPKPLSALDAINQAEAAWQTLDAKQSEQTLIRWRHRAVGLN